MKTYVLTVSKTFPKTHKRYGENTYFIDKIKYIYELGNGAELPCLLCDNHYTSHKGNCSICFNPKKIHTIRANYKLWSKRAKEVNEGKAILSIRYWSGKPYNSKQVEVVKLKNIEVQKILFFENNIMCPYAYDKEGIGNHAIYSIEDVAKNDGLKLDDFVEWFKKYDLSEPMAIIHFTDFRY